VQACSGRRTACAAAVALAAAAALLLPGGAGAGDPEALRNQADRLRSENATLASEAERALLDLYSLETRLRAAERRLGALARRAEELERATERARAQLELARRDLARAESVLAARLRALYIEGDVDPLAILLGASSLDEVISALDGFGRLADQDRRIVEELKDARVELRSAVRRFQARRAEVEALVARARTAQASLRAARAERVEYLAGLRRQRELNGSQIGGLVDQAAAAESRTQQLGGSGGGGFAAGPPPATGSKLTVSSTGYCLRGTTATGIPVAWGVVAVDPQVIPLGTRMFVPGYGEGVAADTGSAVTGHIIDLWFPTCTQAITWGRRTVTITLL
jgi:3D (Asp-Asp-Asp) domain-containing protein/peptidoglycan hydrolase CwlO-like protein